MNLAVKVQLFVDGDIMVFIANPSKRFDAETYNFLERAYKKIENKIKSLAALRRDIQRIGSLSGAALTESIVYYLDYDSPATLYGILGVGFFTPELWMWGRQFFNYLFTRKQPAAT